MSGNQFGTLFRMSTFGESHGPAVGVIVDGCPAGIPVAETDIQRELDRRRPGQSELTTPRNEPDRVEILSGIFEGKTTGAPVCMVVFNRNQNPKDYSEIRDKFRPGHADFSWQAKFGRRDHRGGGRSSSRETIGRVCAGALAKQILSMFDIQVLGHVIQVGPIRSSTFNPDAIEQNPVRCADPDAAIRMAEHILSTKAAGDSVGGLIEVTVSGLLAGIGEPVFDRLHADLGKAILSIPAVKGIEFGDGFRVVARRGSENNDELTPDGFKSNHAGGTLGGISTGQELVFRFPVKPPSSIQIPGDTIDLDGKPVRIETHGRHDPCIAPRVVPIAEAMTAMVLVDHLMRHQARQLPIK